MYQYYSSFSVLCISPCAAIVPPTLTLAASSVFRLVLKGLFFLFLLMRDGLVSVSSWLLSPISSALHLFFPLSRPLPLPPLLTTRPSLSVWASHPSTCPLPLSLLWAVVIRPFSCISLQADAKNRFFRHSQGTTAHTTVLGIPDGT
ncbi:hypothetical protein BJX65DRAFT_246521 [Aspergillus insuetus]